MTRVYDNPAASRREWWVDDKPECFIDSWYISVMDWEKPWGRYPEPPKVKTNWRRLTALPKTRLAR